MKKILIGVMLGFLLPVLVFAEGQVFNNPIPLNSNTLDTARNLSANIESRVKPESAKDKSLWVWIREKANGAAEFISGSVKSLNSFVGDKWRSLLTSSAFDKVTGVAKSILQAGRDFIREIFDYIKQKI